MKDLRSIVVGRQPVRGSVPLHFGLGLCNDLLDRHILARSVSVLVLVPHLCVLDVLFEVNELGDWPARYVHEFLKPMHR